MSFVGPAAFHIAGTSPCLLKSCRACLNRLSQDQPRPDRLSELFGHQDRDLGPRDSRGHLTPYFHCPLRCTRCTCRPSSSDQVTCSRKRCRSGASLLLLRDGKSLQFTAKLGAVTAAVCQTLHLFAGTRAGLPSALKRDNQALSATELLMSFSSDGLSKPIASSRRLSS